jgi:hypothetical protein
MGCSCNILDLFGKCLVCILTGILVILNEVFQGFPQSLKAYAGIVPQLGHDCSLSDLFQIVIHLSSIHLMLYILVTESVIKQPINKECVAFT